MTLSERATRYFNKLKRDEELFLNKETTIDYCKKQNFPLTNTLLKIETNFSGYKLTITNDTGHGFLLRLFGKYDFDENREIEYYHFGDSYVVDFGEHDTAPFHFYVTDKGELCTLGHQEGETPNIVCSSIEKCIEQYALMEELTSQKKDRCYYEVLNSEALNKVLEQLFTKIEECSDKYSQWFTNGQLTVDKGTWLDRPEFYLHVYGQSETSINDFVSNLKNLNLIA